MGWCVVGDFNEIVSQDERHGGRKRKEGRMELFRCALENGGWIDLG